MNVSPEVASGRFMNSFQILQKAQVPPWQNPVTIQNSIRTSKADKRATVYCTVKEHSAELLFQ